MSKGLFITFEGLDGTGKTTQMAALEARMQQQGLVFLRTREPGGTPVGEKIREVILDPAHPEMCPRAEALLYAASRAQHVTEVILPALEQGVTVICDRFFDSSLAYQGYARMLPLGEVEAINRFAMQGLNPDLTFLLDIPPGETVSRMQERSPDRLEQEADDFKKRVRAGFLKIASFEPGRIRVLDATRPIEELAEEVWNQVSCQLRDKGMR